jgi:6-phosphofructokinase 1
MEDAKTTGRWYFITTMGRHAGHLALGIGKAAGATISLIPEEFKAGKMALRSIGDVLAGSIIKRLSMGRDHGVAILAEGLTDLLDPEELRKYEVCQLDETGRLRLSEILLGRILKVFVGETLESFGIKMTIVDKNVGYELRAAHPIPFDVDYTRSLGYGAVRFLLRGGTGAVIVVEEGHMRPIPFVEMMDYSTGRVKVRTVDTQSINYEVARKYMIRLEREDFEGKALAQLAKTAGLKPDEFRERFSHVL